MNRPTSTATESSTPRTRDRSRRRRRTGAAAERHRGDHVPSRYGSRHLAARAGRRVRMIAPRCRGLEHGPRSSSAVRSLRSHRRRSDGGRKPDLLLPKSSPAQTFRTLEGGRRGRNRVYSTHRAPIPTAVVGPSRWRTRRCRWRWPPRRRRSPPHPRAAQGCPDPGRAPSPAGPPGCGAAPVARRAST